MISFSPSTDKKKCIISAYVSYMIYLTAFDTIDHNILLFRLKSNCGISDTALSLLSSYLSNRTQSFLIGNSSYSSFPLLTGVPQNSVLGLLLFCLYTSPLGPIFSNSPVSYHLYADYTQLYIFFLVLTVYSLSALFLTLDSVYSWFTSNRLSVNPSKTEFLLIGTPQQCAKLTFTSVLFCGTALTPSDSCRILSNNFSNVCRLSLPHTSTASDPFLFRY